MLYATGHINMSNVNGFVQTTTCLVLSASLVKQMPVASLGA